MLLMGVSRQKPLRILPVAALSAALCTFPLVHSSPKSLKDRADAIFSNSRVAAQVAPISQIRAPLWAESAQKPKTGRKELPAGKIAAAKVQLAETGIFDKIIDVVEYIVAGAVMLAIAAAALAAVFEVLEMAAMGLLAVLGVVGVITNGIADYAIPKRGDKVRKDQAKTLKEKLRAVSVRAKESGALKLDGLMPEFEKVEAEIAAFRGKAIKKFGDKGGWEKIEKAGIGHYTDKYLKLTMTVEDEYFLSFCNVVLLNIRKKLENAKDLDEAFECSNLKVDVFDAALERAEKAGNPRLDAPLRFCHAGLDSAWRATMKRIGKPHLAWHSYRI